MVLHIIQFLKRKKAIKSLDEVDPEILKTFEKIRYFLLDEQKKLSNVAVDAVFDSVSIATTYTRKISQIV